MVAPLSGTSTDDTVMDADLSGYDFYKKSEVKEYGFEDDVELFRLTAHLADDDYVSSQDSQDSNAEQYYTNDYPEDYWSD